MLFFLGITWRHFSLLLASNINLFPCDPPDLFLRSLCDILLFFGLFLSLICFVFHIFLSPVHLLSCFLFRKLFVFLNWFFWTCSLSQFPFWIRSFFRSFVNRFFRSHICFSRSFAPPFVYAIFSICSCSSSFVVCREDS